MESLPALVCAGLLWVGALACRDWVLAAEAALVFAAKCCEPRASVAGLLLAKLLHAIRAPEAPAVLARAASVAARVAADHTPKEALGSTRWMALCIARQVACCELLGAAAHWTLLNPRLAALNRAPALALLASVAWAPTAVAARFLDYCLLIECLVLLLCAHCSRKPRPSSRCASPSSFSSSSCSSSSSNTPRRPLLCPRLATLATQAAIWLLLHLLAEGTGPRGALLQFFLLLVGPLLLLPASPAASGTHLSPLASSCASSLPSPRRSGAKRT